MRVSYSVLASAFIQLGKFLHDFRNIDILRTVLSAGAASYAVCWLLVRLNILEIILPASVIFIFVINL